MKNRVRVIVMIIVMILVMGISVLILNPDLKEKIFVGSGKNSEEVENRIVSKSEKMAPIDDSRRDTTENTSSKVGSEKETTEKISHGDYYIQFHEQLEKNLKSSDSEVRAQTLQSLNMAEQLMKNVNPGNKAMCTVCMDSENESENYKALEYSVINARLTDNVDEFDIAPSDFNSIHRDSTVQSCVRLQEGFQFVVIDLEIKNVTGKNVMDVPVLGIYYYLIDDDGTEWANEICYGTLQPGRNPQHKYFIREMADGEVASTTVFATVPTDSQFDTYSHYLKVNPFGYTDYVDGGMALIRLDEYLTKDSQEDSK